MNRSNMSYIDLMYGKSSQKYTIAENLTVIKNILNQQDTVTLTKDCKMETISYIATFVNNNEKVHFTLKKKQINKNSGKSKEKMIEEKMIETSKKYQILDWFIDVFCYDLLIKGYTSSNKNRKI